MSLVSNILIFDSGVGGLSVYQEIYQLLPKHNYIYLFDNQAYPYGELPSAVLIERVLSLVTYAVNLHSIDIVVIACNTASTLVLPALRKKLNIPVVGVVPAIKPACRISQKSIGLIATPATVTREYITGLINDFSMGKPVIRLGSSELVDMAEMKIRGEAINLDLMAKILQPLIEKVDVAVLGCTHFPLLREEIQQVMGKNVELVDSGYAIACQVRKISEAQNHVRHSRKPFEMYASATPDKQVALNKAVSQLGFNQIEPLQVI